MERRRRRERAAEREEDPQGLQAPRHEERAELLLHLVEAPVRARAVDAQEEERAEPQRPDGRHPHQERAPQVGLTEDERDADERQIGEAADEVVVPLGPRRVRRHERDPVDCKRQPGTDPRQRQAERARAPVPRRPRDEGGDEGGGGDDRERLEHAGGAGRGVPWRIAMASPPFARGRRVDPNAAGLRGRGPQRGRTAPSPAIRCASRSPETSAPWTVA